MESYKGISVGKKYKNFKGYEREVISIFEAEGNKIKITYDDHTGNPRTCNADTFIEWTKKCYY